MKKKLPENFKIKILSILVAFGMWVYVMEVNDPIMTRTLDNIPISTITNMSEITEKGLTISYGQDLTVDIDIRGSRSYVTTYLSSGVKVEGFVDNPRAGENILTLNLPPVSGIEYSFNPRTFFIKLEESIIEEKNLNISTVGEPKENFSVESITLSKQMVYIEGSKTQVDKVEQIIGNINIENVEKNFSQRVQLTPVDKNGAEVEGVVINGSFVVADVKMQKSKDVPVQLNIVNSFGEIMESKAIKPDKDTITITGSAEIIDTITGVETQLIHISDINQFPEKRYDLTPINYVRFSDNRISIVGIEEEMQEYHFTIPKEEVQFLAENNTEDIMTLLPEEIGVTFKSSKEYSEILSEDSVRIYVDNSVAANTYRLRYTVEYPIANMVMEPSNINLDA